MCVCVGGGGGGGGENDTNVPPGPLNTPLTIHPTLDSLNLACRFISPPRLSFTAFSSLQVIELSHLERCLKETLRLRPPIMTMMRMAKTPQVTFIVLLNALCALS